VAFSLARPGDPDLVRAVVHSDDIDDPWAALAATAATHPAAELCSRGQLVGLACSVLPDGREAEQAIDPTDRTRIATASMAPRRSHLLVVDLSVLWAGPLCAKLLGQAGARVVKVESVTRPDGARFGSSSFYDWLHEGHESIALDFGQREDIAGLHRLLARADIVIESSRPRALEALGIRPAAVLSARPGSSWVSITGHGRSGPDGNKVALGDDASVAAGVVARDREGGPVFCGDALADPIAGLVAAVAAMTSLRQGGGELIDVAMSQALCALAHPRGDDTWQPVVTRTRTDDWTVQLGEEHVDVRRPSAPQLASSARPLGADTRAVLSELSDGGP
jgi:hypothetical protein